MQWGEKKKQKPLRQEYKVKLKCGKKKYEKYEKEKYLRWKKQKQK